MAEDAELVGGISVNLGANDARLIGDLAEAEKLVQQWAAQAAEVQLGARFVGGAGGAPGGGGADLATMTKAIEQAFTNVTLRQPTRTQQAQPTRTVYGAGATTAAASQQGQTNLQKAIADKLAETGEMYDEQTGEVKKIAGVLDGQREEMAATTRATRQMFAVQEDNPSLDISALQSKITTLSGALDSLLGRLVAFTEALPMPRLQTAEEPRPAARQAPVPVPPTAAPTPVRVTEAVRVEAAAEPVKVETQRPTSARVEEEARAAATAVPQAPVPGEFVQRQRGVETLLPGVEQPGYRYHATSQSSVEDIRREGLVPQGPSFRGEQEEWPDRGEEPRTYFGATAKSTLPFRPGEGPDAMLRVKESERITPERGTGDYISRVPIPPEEVEVFNAQGAWQPLATPSPVTATGGGRKPPRRPRTAVQTPADDEEPESTGRPYGPPLQIVDRIERQRRQSREVAGQSPLEVNRSEASLFAQRQREEAEAAKATQRVSVPPPPPDRSRPISRVEYFAHTTPEEREEAQGLAAQTGAELGSAARPGAQPRATAPPAQAGLRQRYVDAIAAVRRGEPAADPETGQPVVAISQEHALRSLRTRMNTLGAQEAEAPAAPEPARPRTLAELEETVRVRREATDAAEAEREVRRAAAPQRSTVALAQEQATRERGPKTLEQLQEEQRVAVEADEATPRSARPTPVPRTRSNMTPEEIARDERFRRDQAFAEQANAPRPRPRLSPVASAVRAAQQEQEQVFAKLSGEQASPEAQEERIQQRIEAGRANVAAATSTGRTSASRIASVFGGTGGRRLEADQRARAAREELNAANRAALPIERRLAIEEGNIAKAVPDVAEGLRKARDAFKEDPRTVSALTRQKEAYEGVAKATEEYQKLQSGGNIVRNLSAIALGSFAFSAALKAVDIAVSAVTPALGSFIDEQLGFASTSTRVTSALAAQTLAMHGNAEATLAQAEAQAGLSQGAAETLNAQLRLTTQVKAGALAQQQASDLFRAGAGTGQGAPQGLYGGYGGIGGSALLAGQIGGGKGFTEQLLGDISAFQNPKKGPDFLGDLNQGLSYVTNPDVRQTVNEQAQQQGNPIMDLLGAAGQAIPFVGPSLNALGKANEITNPAAPAAGPSGGAVATPTSELTAYLNDLNKAAERGAGALGQTVRATYEFETSQQKIQEAMVAAAQDGDQFGVAMARLGVIIRDTSGNVADAAERRQANTQAAVGRGRIDPATLAAQFNVSDQALVGQLGRTQQYQLQTQMPAQAALQNLAAPPTPVGTGIVAANAGEQERITKGQERSIVLQRQLDDYYAQGREQLENTYKPAIVQAFGAAAGQAFSDNLSGIQALGKEIAGIQASISNEQAAYATAQYNQQLFIARRTLSDINGLTNRNFGGAGQSYLGQLEKENLALGRQGQMLQFAMSQRQINYQTALAGFQAPGVTPAERQANIKEAQIEAGFAQKQLDIQRQMFGNQVEIVDISNLRQGVDLARQIGLLVQGRQVTIDVAVKQEQLIRAQQRSEQLVKQAGTYLTAVDTLAGTAISHIQEMETAAGKALSRVEVQAVKLVNKYFADLYGVFNASFRGTPPAGSSSPVGQGGGGRGGARHGGTGATGMLGSTKGTTDITIGEAGEETVAVLRNPRAYLGGGGGGGVTIGSIFSGPVTVRSDSDITRLAREVQKVIGREASLRGLRATSG